jgi:hypothetical protein
MITRLTHGAALIALLATITTANAIPDVKLFPYQVMQVSTTERAQVGLVVQGIGVGLYFTVGGGYTLTCQDSPSNISAENSQPYFAANGKHSVTIAVPPATPTRYEIAGFNSWPFNTCHLCEFKHRGRAIEASTTIAAGTGGVSFSFNPSGGLEATRSDVAQFSMCKLAPRQGFAGCYP